MAKKYLFTLQIKSDIDVVLARRRARQLAFLLGFDSHDQTRISTAVSEIARNALVHAGGGCVEFGLEDKLAPFRFVIALTDNGPGIPNINQISSGTSEHVGLLGASRLVDKFSATNLEQGGTLVRLEKIMAQRQIPFSDTEVNELANSLMKLVASNPVDEVHQQNQELLAALDQLSQQQLELDKAYLEVAEKNDHLLTLNQEMTILNSSLEMKVKERTTALQNSNIELSLARDQAVKANAVKSQFVANISHEIRTPMSGILSSTELMLEEAASMAPEFREMTRLAHESAKGLMTVINDLLDFAKLESGKQSLVEREFLLPPIIAEVIASVSLSAKIKSLPIYQVIAPPLHNTILTGDPIVLKRVIQNLLHNAIKFTPSGEVRISVSIVEQSEDSVRIKSIVSDTGIGIAESDKERLFQPFVQADSSNTRKYGGTGLGLSISNSFVSLMGGKIGFESVENQGSEFWFEVPLKVTLR